MPDLAFRYATGDDISAVVALVESAYRGPSSRLGWTSEAGLLDGQRIDAEMAHDVLAGANVLLAERQGELIACCELRLVPGDAAYFGMFAVRPGLQGSGLGRVVLAEAERRAHEADAATMELTVIRQRTELIAWYERRGYSVTGATHPFPYGDARFGLPRRDDLEFVTLAKALATVDG